MPSVKPVARVPWDAVAFPQYRKAPKKAEEGEKRPRLFREQILLKKEWVKLCFALNGDLRRMLI